MASPLLTAADMILCRHGGRALATAPTNRVTVAGTPIILQAPPGLILDCPGNGGNPGGRCVGVIWLSGTTRVRSQGLPLVTGASQGITSAGPVISAATQARVLAR